MKDVLKIQANRSHDVLVGRQPPINNVCVIHNVTAEDKAAARSVYDVHGPAEGDENADDARHH